MNAALGKVPEVAPDDFRAHPAGVEAAPEPLPAIVVADDAVVDKIKGDMEPVDPAEQRPQLMPPERPLLRAGGTWVSRGPAPAYSAQVVVPPDDEVSGAVQAIAAHPIDPNILYIGAVNGGVWRTANATAARPTWTPLTDHMPSQSIGALALDPLDTTHQTLIVGTARVSSFSERGDDEIGIYYSTNGGDLWSRPGSANLLGEKLIAVAARGPILMAASRTGGLFRSTNTGGLFTMVSGTSGLPWGGIFDLVGDPGNHARFYIAVAGFTPKILRSDDNGANWIDITAGLAGLSISTNNMRLSVGAMGVLYLATINDGVLARVSRSPDLGATWTPMDVPAIHPGSQGNIHASIAADPSDPNLVYIGGDAHAVAPFAGNLFRGDAALAAGSQFVTITDAGGGNTSPHCDSRALVFDSNANLLNGNDGGIYRRSSPTSASGTWGSVIGNLSIMEVHDLAHDRVADVIMIGTQDNGTQVQPSANSLRWNHILDGDGGDVAIDDSTLAGGSYRYLSSQELGGFQRAQYDPLNAFVATLLLPSIPDPDFVTPIELNVGNQGRMLIGGKNAIYESTNVTGAAPSITSLGPPGTSRNAMAYGSIGNPGAAYVGKGAAVYVRQGNAFVITTALPAGAEEIWDVALDPDDAMHVFAIDDNQVFRSTDGGGSWQDVTGNLPSISSTDFRTIEYIPGEIADLVALGSRSGVFSTVADSSIWSLVGANLPDVPVFDLRYLADSQTLLAGTLGRGVWSTRVVVQPAFAYITNEGSNNVSVIDTTSNLVVATVAVGTAPYGIAVNRALTRAYVTNTDSNNVSIIDTTTNDVVATVPVGTTPFAVALNPSGSRAYVANNDSNNVSVIDTVSNSVVATIAVGMGARGVAVNPGGTRVFVTNINSNNVSVIAIPGNNVLTTIPVGTGPFGVAFNPASTRAYVSNFGSANVSVIDTATNAVLTSISVGNGPVGVATNPILARAYVANFGSDSVSVIDTASNSVITTIAVGVNPIGVSINAAGTRAYVANRVSNSVSVIDTASNAVIATVAVGTDPSAFGTAIGRSRDDVIFVDRFGGSGAATPPGAPVIGTATAGNGQASIAFTPPNFSGGSPITAYTLICNPHPFSVGGAGSPLVLTGLANGTSHSCFVTASNAIGAGPASASVEVTPLGPPPPPFAYITNQSSNNVSVINTATNTVVATVPTGNTPYGVAVNPAGTRVYVSNINGDTVSVIDTSNNTVTATLDLGVGPYGIAFNPAGTRVYVAVTASNNVSVFDTATHALVATVGVGSGPRGVVVNPAGTLAYITNNSSNDVSVINTVTNTVVATFGVGASPIGVAINAAGSRLYVANGNSSTLSVVDTAGNTVVATVPLASGPSGVAINAAGTRVYVAKSLSNAVAVIDTASNTVIANVPTPGGSHPLGVSLTPDGTRLYVANLVSDNVTVIDTGTNTVVTTVAVGTFPFAFGTFIGVPPVVNPPEAH